MGALAAAVELRMLKVGAERLNGRGEHKSYRVHGSTGKRIRYLFWKRRRQRRPGPCDVSTDEASLRELWPHILASSAAVVTAKTENLIDIFAAKYRLGLMKSMIMRC